MSNAILFYRSKDARNAMLEMGKERQKELFEIMKEVYIHRKKTEVLKDCMTEKKEKGKCDSKFGQLSF